MLRELKGKCQVCGEEFLYRKAKMYCSAPCKQKAFRFKDLKVYQYNHFGGLRMDLYEQYLKHIEKTHGLNPDAVKRGDVKGIILASEFLYLIKKLRFNNLDTKNMDYLLVLLSEHKIRGYNLQNDPKFIEFNNKYLAGELNIEI